MFMGSQHAPYPMFGPRARGCRRQNNGSTTEDATNYTGRTGSALPLMLWLDADRIGWLLPTMDVASSTRNATS